MDRVQQYGLPRNLTPTEAEGIVVSDHKGLVVLWPDGHCSRFVWPLLRHVCPCEKCQHQQEQGNGSSTHLDDNRDTTVEV